MRRTSMGLKYTEASLKKKSVADLKELASDLFDEDELDEITTKQPLIDKLVEVEDDEEVEEDDEVEESDDEEEVEEDDADPELPDEEEEDEVDEPAPAKSKAAAKKQTKYTESGKADNGEKLLGAKEVATAIGTDAKSLRQFFRSGKSSFTAVGAGGRYEFKESDVEKIKSEFETWKAGKPGRGRGTSEGGSTRSRSTTRGREVKPEDQIEEVEEIEELEDLEELDEADLELEEED
jgi:hypothetical protein